MSTEIGSSRPVNITDYEHLKSLHTYVFLTRTRDRAAVRGESCELTYLVEIFQVSLRGMVWNDSVIPRSMSDVKGGRTSGERADYEVVRRFNPNSMPRHALGFSHQSCSVTHVVHLYEADRELRENRSAWKVLCGPTHPVELFRASVL